MPQVEHASIRRDHPPLVFVAAVIKHAAAQTHALIGLIEGRYAQRLEWPEWHGDIGKAGKRGIDEVTAQISESKIRVGILSPNGQQQSVVVQVMPIPVLVQLREVLRFRHGVDVAVTLAVADELGSQCVAVGIIHVEEHFTARPQVRSLEIHAHGQVKIAPITRRSACPQPAVGVIEHLVRIQVFKREGTNLVPHRAENGRRFALFVSGRFSVCLGIAAWSGVDSAGDATLQGNFGAASLRVATTLVVHAEPIGGGGNRIPHRPSQFIGR